MSSRKVEIDNLSKCITEIFNDYVDEIDDAVKSITDETIKDAQKEVKIKSPKNKGNYAESWNITTRNNKNGTYSKVVYNKEYPSLTHLLEFGKKKKNGGYVNPQPHIRETEDKYREKFVEEFEREAKR